ncbi:MAG: hypothetical protein QOG38_2834, partial [Hyphomicrobiales bacterium]|nr:hypothetical protein [Hyphomicrobiales bacterium]
SIRDGQIALGSLHTPGLGAGAMPDFGSMNESPIPRALPQAGEEATPRVMQKRG